MARVVILGAGVSGHTAALFLNKYLGKRHEVVVITPNSSYNWIPSNVWVGVGSMKKEQVIFPLRPLYEKTGIDYRQAKALSIHPDGDNSIGKPYVTIEYTDEGKTGQKDTVTYDFLINATGPKLKFEATTGLGPDKNSLSICSHDHAEHANHAFQESLDRMKRGERQTFLVGTGHGNCTCQGAAFEYIFNLEYEIRRRKLRDKADFIWISNEYELGDFGVGGLHLKRGGYITQSKIFAESLYAERGIQWITQAHVNKVNRTGIEYENLSGHRGGVNADFMMLLPPFSGVGLKAFDRNKKDITDLLFAPNGFMKVDADYTKKPYEEWTASDWPRTMQNPTYPNIFAVGIAFAPPHSISKPMQNEKGTTIFPAPPRTGMPSAMMGKAVALSLRDMILRGKTEPTHTASMAEVGAACVASAGKNLFGGTAAAMTMFPIIPDYERYPRFGRSLRYTTGEIGLAAHWIKHLLHIAFLHKAKRRPLWSIIPE